MIFFVKKWIDFGGVFKSKDVIVDYYYCFCYRENEDLVLNSGFVCYVVVLLSECGILRMMYGFMFLIFEI